MLYIIISLYHALAREYSQSEYRKVVAYSRVLHATFPSCASRIVLAPGGVTPTKVGWGCAAHLPKPLPYL